MAILDLDNRDTSLPILGTQGATSQPWREEAAMRLAELGFDDARRLLQGMGIIEVWTPDFQRWQCFGVPLVKQGGDVGVVGFGDLTLSADGTTYLVRGGQMPLDGVGSWIPLNDNPAEATEGYLVVPDFPVPPGKSGYLGLTKSAGFDPTYLLGGASLGFIDAPTSRPVPQTVSVDPGHQYPAGFGVIVSVITTYLSPDGMICNGPINYWPSPVLLSSIIGALCGGENSGDGTSATLTYVFF